MDVESPHKLSTQLTKNQVGDKARNVPKASWNFISSEATSPMPEYDAISTQSVPSSSYTSNEAQIQAFLSRTVKLPACALSIQT